MKHSYLIERAQPSTLSQLKRNRTNLSYLYYNVKPKMLFFFFFFFLLHKNWTHQLLNSHNFTSQKYFFTNFFKVHFEFRLYLPLRHLFFHFSHGRSHSFSHYFSFSFSKIWTIHPQILPNAAFVATTFSYVSTPIRDTLFATVLAQTSLIPSNVSQSSQFDF